MNSCKPLACVLALAWALPAQTPLVEFQNGQVADANAVNANFKTLQLQSIKLQRPAFRSISPTTIAIPASPTQPGWVVIDNLALRFTQQLLLNLGVTGLGGLDTGVVQATRLYYVYLVKGVQQGTVEAVASLNPPATGPLGFSGEWSYLGSFTTNSSASLARFRFSRGRYVRFTDSGLAVTTTSTTEVQLPLAVPEHATEVYGRFVVAGGLLVGTRTLSAGPDLGNIQAIVNDTPGLTGVANVAFASVPLFEGPAIYMKVSSAPFVATFEPYGWTEDPTLFQ